MVLAALLLACSRPPDPSQALLPTQLSVVVLRRDPFAPADHALRPVSAVLDLRRNSQDQLDVRVSEGLRLWDGRHLWEISPTFDARGHGLRVGDLRANRAGEVPLYAAEPLDVVGMTRRDLWVRLPNGAVFECVLDRPACEASRVEDLPLTHPGPGVGFTLSLENGELRLQMPFSVGATALLLDHVEMVLGVHWVHEPWLDKDPVLDRTYRGTGTLVALPRSVTLDGRLDEWPGTLPLVVDAPWQIDSGGTSWGGPRDAGFSIAAARPTAGAPEAQNAAGAPEAKTTVCFAGRARDDEWTPDDTLTLTVGESQRKVALDGPSTDLAKVRPEWFSVSFEVCMPVEMGTEDAAFSAVLTDRDADGVTVLTSAPMVAGRPQGALRFSP